MSQSWSVCQIFWYKRKGLVTRNIQVKYESFMSNSSKVIGKVKVL